MQVASLEDEVSAMRALERALTKALALDPEARLRVLGWTRSRVRELVSEIPMAPENVPPKRLGGSEEVGRGD
jgi:hypothetical protein